MGEGGLPGDSRVEKPGCFFTAPATHHPNLETASVQDESDSRINKLNALSHHPILRVGFDQSQSENLPE